MDTLINIAKQEFFSHSSHSEVSKTGGSEYNYPHHSGQDRSFGSVDLDHEEILRTSQHHGSGDESLFSNALGHLNQNKHEHTEPIDEEHIHAAHKAVYSDKSGHGQDASSMGSAAALQILQHLTSGGSSSSKSGGGTSELISMAMAEASKLFDSAGGSSKGSKQDAVNSAGMTIMKLVVQSKMGASSSGHGSSGGLTQLMGLASKFL